MGKQLANRLRPKYDQGNCRPGTFAQLGGREIAPAGMYVPYWPRSGICAGHRGGGEPACTPDSVPRAPCGGPRRRPSLSAGGCPTALAAYPGVLVGPGSPPPFWPCSGWGLPSRPGHPGRWCALTAPFHPYLCGTPGGVSPSAVCFLWHCPAGRPDWVLSSTLPYGVRTFLGPVPAPEGTDPARGRPAGSPPDHDSTGRCPARRLPGLAWFAGGD